MAFRLVAIDLDDTLLTGDLKITPRTKEAIGEARSKGVHITLSTGRMFCSAIKFAEDLGLDVPLITYQGALVKDSRRVHYFQPLPLELARVIIDVVQRHGYHLNLYVNDRLYVASVNAEAEAYAAIAGVDMNPVGDLQEFLQTDPIKLLVINEEAALEDLALELAPILKKRVYITKSKPYYLEFLHPRATKADGLEALAKNLGISPQEIIAIGDSFNDLEMLKYAGLGVAMGNARPEIRMEADYVAPGNNEDGVAEVIEKFVLKRGA